MPHQETILSMPRGAVELLKHDSTVDLQSLHDILSRLSLKRRQCEFAENLALKSANIN